MADDAPKTNGGGEPPKIKLNLGNGITRPPATPPPPPPATASGIRIKPSDKKAETTRIDLALAQPPRSVGDTQPVQPDIHEAAKRATVRVDVPPVAKADTQRVKAETARVDPSKQATMRVEVDPKRKAETTRIDLPADSFRKPARPDAATAASSTDDVFKRQTIPVGVPTPAPTPAKPKTMQVKKPMGRPGESTPPPTPPPAEVVTEAKKSETARIDLPPDTGADRPATRPKTIRIKRPDGTSARKALTIARPSEDEPTVAPTLAGGEEDEEAGTLWSALALVAVVVACVVVYVLAAQTFAPNLPFAGRL